MREAEVERLKAELAAAEAKAEHYERDWYAAKSEFGTAMAKMRDKVRAVEAELDHAMQTAIDLDKKLAAAEAKAEHYEHVVSDAVVEWMKTLTDSERRDVPEGAGWRLLAALALEKP